MADDELMAQMLGIVLEGVQGGGQPAIEKLYGKYDDRVPEVAVKRLDRSIVRMLDDELVLAGTPLSRGPHFLMLFAAVAHATGGIPVGDIGEEEMPLLDGTALSDAMMTRSNLGLLSDVILMDESEVPARFFEFKYAAAGTTHRIRSRKPRFLAFYRALLPEPI